MGLFRQIGRFWRHLLGVTLAQVVAGLAVYLAASNPQAGLWGVAVLLALSGGALTAYLFTAIAAAEGREHGASLGLAHARERETLRVMAEQARVREERRRVREVREAERRIARAQARTGLPLRAGLVGGGVVGLGVALIAANFLALGAVAVSLVGGAALGWRLRGARLARAADAPPLLEATPAAQPPLLSRLMRRPAASRPRAAPDAVSR